MSHWNYRIMKRTINGETGYTLHEVYYNDAGEIEGYTEDPIAPFGTDIEDLRINIWQMRQAFDKPVLEYEKLGENFDRAI